MCRFLLFIFSISYLESAQCVGSQDGSIAGCMHEQNRVVNDVNLTLEINTAFTHDISSLISQSQRSRAPLGYRRDNCGQENTCAKVDLISG